MTKKLAFLLAFITIGVVLYVRFGEALNFETIEANQERLLAWRDRNYALAIFAFFLTYAIATLFSLPIGIYLTLIGGFLFGTWAGGLTVVVGATIGGCLVFLASKWLFGDRLYQRIEATSSKAIRAIKNGFERDGTSYLLITRLVPIFPFWLVNIVPSFLGVPFRTYALTTFFGIMPATFVMASIGAGLSEVLARGERPDLSIFTEIYVIGPILALAALSALPIFLKKLGYLK